MKKILFIVMFFVAFLITSCSSNSPKAVAEKFITAMENGDFEEAKKYADDSMGQLLGMLGGLEKDLQKEKEKKKITITRAEEDGDKAKVFYKVEGEEKEKDIDLKKVDGKWKVTFNKENANKENTPNLNDTEPEENVIDSLQTQVTEGIEEATQEVEATAKEVVKEVDGAIKEAKEAVKKAE
ncbi:MAG: DUF4878 domain-containing protein [Capnocytophaga sp.]|nr:DUF4878 domain-containing protein [Capnocytophaga sp.]